MNKMAFELGEAVLITSQPISIMFYADDIALQTTSENNLQ